MKKASILGSCNSCRDGEVKFYRFEMSSVRFCDNCGISTRKGDAVFTTGEAALWK